MFTTQSRGVCLCLALLFLLTVVPASADTLDDLFALFSQASNTAFANGFTQGQRTSLVTKVIGAITAVQRGNEHAARGSLGAFVHEVEALQRSGRLPAEDAQALIDSAEGIAAQM